MAGAIITNKRGGSNECTLAHRSKLCRLLLSFDFDQRFSDLSIGCRDLLLHSGDFQVGMRDCAFTLFDIAFCDKAGGKEFVRLISALFSLLDAVLVKREQLLQARLVLPGSLDVFVAQP